MRTTRINFCFFSIVLVILVMASCDSEKVLSVYPNGNPKESLEGDLEEHSGVYRKYFQNGIIMEESLISNKKHEGVSIRYFKGGSIKAKSFFKNGVQEGAFVEFKRDGSINHIGYARSGKRVGRFYFDKTHDGALNECVEFFMIVSGNEYSNGEFCGKIDLDEKKIKFELFGDKVSISLGEAYSSEVVMVLGDYNNELILEDSSSLMGYLVENNQILLPYEGGGDTLRGFISYGEIIVNGNEMFEKAGSEIYFEYPSKVKEFTKKELISIVNKYPCNY